MSIVPTTLVSNEMDQRRHIQGIEQTANSMGNEGADNDRGTDLRSGRKYFTSRLISLTSATKQRDIDNSSGRAASRDPSPDHRSVELRNNRYEIEMTLTTTDGGLGR
jgi:hypothetical protein